MFVAVCVRPASDAASKLLNVSRAKSQVVKDAAAGGLLEPLPLSLQYTVNYVGVSAWVPARVKSPSMFPSLEGLGRRRSQSETVDDNQRQASLTSNSQWQRSCLC